jgi:predicted transcriptional regulator
MASSPPLSILDVERLLEEKKSQIEELVAKREKLQKQILDLDQQMHDAANRDSPTPLRYGLS